MEMNREELNTLISSLEAANKVYTHRPLTLCVYMSFPQLSAVLADPNLSKGIVLV